MLEVRSQRAALPRSRKISVTLSRDSFTRDMQRSASSIRRSGRLLPQNAQRNLQQLVATNHRRYSSYGNSPKATSTSQDSQLPYRQRMLAAPKLQHEELPGPRRKRKWTSVQRRPLPSQLTQVFTQVTSKNSSNTSSQDASNTKHSQSDGNDTSSVSPTVNRRASMIQSAAQFPLSRRKINVQPPGNLAIGFNLRFLLAQYNQRKPPTLALWSTLSSLVEALARSLLFKEAQSKLDEMESLGYENRPAYARAQAMLLIFQSQIHQALETFTQWVDNFVSTAIENDFQYQRDFATLKSIYIGIFEQLFRRGFPHLAHELSQHAEKVKVDVSGATLSLMVPHLLQKLDMESVVTQSITRHMSVDGHVPIETFRVLIRACVGQKNYTLGLRLVDSFLDAKNHAGERLNAAESRDLLFLFFVMGQSERATNLMTEMLDRGSLDDRAIGTILDALTARGFKAELRNWVSQEWWRTSLFSFKVYQKFFLACCKLDDIELALREFERLAVQLDRGVTELFESLIAVLANSGRWVQARDLFQLLRRSKTDLSADILASVLHMSLSYQNSRDANEIMTLINTNKVQYNHKLCREVMNYHASIDDHNAVLRTLNQARNERIAITPSMIAFAMRSCASLSDMDTALDLFNQAASLRLLSDSHLLRVWFHVCGTLRATGILDSTWRSIKEIPNLVIDEVVWLQVVTAYSVCGNILGALEVLSESLLDSTVAIRLSILYPHKILSMTPLLNHLRFLPPRAKAKIKQDWAVSYQTEQSGLHAEQWTKLHDTAPRLSDTDRDTFAAIVTEWIHVYNKTANRTMSEHDYAEAKRKQSGLPDPQSLLEFDDVVTETEVAQKNNPAHSADSIVVTSREHQKNAL